MFGVNWVGAIVLLLVALAILWVLRRIVAALRHPLRRPPRQIGKR
jgi:hypothetical protein